MNTVLLSFDLEEFDMPLEYNFDIALSEQIEVSKSGTEIILTLLNQYKAKATFFTTCIFAQNASHTIRELCKDGHELASHGYYHSQFEDGDLMKSKLELEKNFGQSIRGFRMPRMMPVSKSLLHRSGYQYDSSLNPVFIPGRYNNFFKRRTWYRADDVYELPASATPFIRIPLFWLSFHHFPINLFNSLCHYTMSKDHYLVLYFHPWEFVDLKNKYGLPKLVTKNSGKEMKNRFYELMNSLVLKGYSFSTITDFFNKKNY